MLRRHLRLGNQLDFFVGEFAGTYNTPVAPLEPFVFLRKVTTYI
jgi:hypothetical protein